MSQLHSSFLFFFCNDTATTEIYTLSLHDALPISGWSLTVSIGFTLVAVLAPQPVVFWPAMFVTLFLLFVNIAGQKTTGCGADRKSTRLNSITVKSRMPSSA